MTRSRSIFALLFTLAACGSVEPTTVDAPMGDVDAAVDAPGIDAPGMVTLSLVKSGTGTGSITSNPAGIDCGATCSGSFPAGTLVTLTAAPALGSTFTGWGGACSGSLTTCSVTLNAATAVNADFGLEMHTVTVAIGGNGTGAVTSAPAGLDCPGTCTVSVPYGTAYTLSASATGASMFAGWSGAGCTGTGACTFTVRDDTVVNASFALNFSLIVTKIGAGTGTVTSSPAGINCGADCSETYPANTTVTLTAAASADSRFIGWSGGCSGSGACTVTISAAVMVTAQFDLQQFTLAVTNGGNGAGTTTSSPAGISCGATCNASYASGTVVTLTPAPSTGSSFASWAGACSGSGACTVTMTQARAVTANYALDSFTLTAATAGTGAGTITSSPAGISCGADCTEAYLYNTSVSLTAAPTGTSTFSGWSGACSGSGACTVTMTQARAVTATFTAGIVQPNLMFVTSTVATGNLGGLAGADAFCQARANAAGRAGTFRAWLSSSTVNAVTRFGSATGWVRVDGKPFANTPANIAAGLLFTPPRLDETGADVLEQTALTATTLNGVFNMNGTDCSAWTSTTGSSNGGLTSANSWMFTVYTQPSCATGGRLYCFGVDRTATVSAPQPSTFRRAFMKLWTPGGGIASADSSCQADATAAGLPGSYRALLATTGASALSRFDLTGAPWYRVDNVATLPTAAAWGGLTTAYFDASPNLMADGSMTFGNYLQWNGAAGMTTAGTAASTCSNWTVTTATAATGNAGTTRLGAYFSGAGAQACSFTSGAITCLQQ